MRWSVFIPVLYFASLAAAHDPITTKITWSREISPLIARRCLSCHGDKAEVALTTYELARPWAKAIRDQVLARAMPPWGAVQGFGQFQGDPTLTQLERDTIVEWVEGGAPEGIESGNAHPQPPLARPRLTGKLIRINQTYNVKQKTGLIGVRPEGLERGGEMRLTASFPDGRTEPILWIRNFPAQPHDFLLMHPLVLPPGAVIHVACKPGQAAGLALVAENF